MKENKLLRIWLVSIFGIILYELGNRITLPFLPLDFAQLTRNTHILDTSSFGMFHFGLGPLLIGFFLIEILSFFLRPLKTWRQQGSGGRKKLTNISLIVSLVIVCTQGYGYLQFLKTAPGPDGSLVWVDPTILKEVIGIVFFMLGTFLLYRLGLWMTRYGIGNGFGILVIYGIIESLVNTVYAHFDSAMQADDRYYFPGLAFLALSIYIVWRFILSQRQTANVEFRKTKIDYHFPIVPQGLLGYIWTINLILLPISLRSFFEVPYFEFNSWPYAFSYLAVIFFVNYFAYYVAYSPKRIENNVEGIALSDSFKILYKKHFIRSSVILGLFGFLLLMPRPFEGSGKFLAELITLNQILLLYFIGLDILRHHRFVCSHKDTVSLVEFDNTHLAESMRAYLKAHQIESYVQGQQFRWLFAFTNPLYKMRLLVAQKDAEAAKRLLQMESAKII